MTDIVNALGLGMSNLFDLPGRLAASVIPVLRPDATRPGCSVERVRARMPSSHSLAHWRSELAESECALDLMWNSKGWTPKGLRDFDAGWDGHRLVLPVRCGDGTLVNVLRYLPGGKPKLLSLAGRPRDLVPAPERIVGDEVWIVEGEPDAISGHTVTLPVTALPGARGWRPEWRGRFIARRVRIVFDCDRAGRTAAANVAASLAGVAAEVRVLDLNPHRADGYDLGDFVRDAANDGVQGLRTARDLLRAAIEVAPPITRERLAT